MSNVNADMHKAVEEQNLDVLREIADYGAWIECTLADDASANTALHKAVMACTDMTDFETEAKRLKIKKSPETFEYGTRSGWRNKCRTRYQIEKLKDEVQTWRNKRITESGVIGYLCLARADPRLLNADGMSALELADGKHPEILGDHLCLSNASCLEHVCRPDVQPISDQLMRQQADLELREQLAEAEQEVHKDTEGMNTTTGLFIRDKYFMRGVTMKMRKMKEHEDGKKDEKATVDSALEKRPDV